MSFGQRNLLISSELPGFSDVVRHVVLAFGMLGICHGRSGAVLVTESWDGLRLLLHLVLKCFKLDLLFSAAKPPGHNPSNGSESKVHVLSLPCSIPYPQHLWTRQVLRDPFEPPNQTLNGLKEVVSC